MVYTKRNLPHLYFEYGIYFVTFRTCDSLPKNMILELKNDKYTKDENKARKIFKKYDDLLDSGKWGNINLLNEDVAKVIKYCLHYPDSKEYILICYTIMSNHVHTVFELIKNNKGLDKIMKSIKGITARESNKILNRSGKFWQDESYDRLIRNEKEFYRVINYVLMNPVKAGLIENWRDWKYSYCNPDYINFIQ